MELLQKHHAFGLKLNWRIRYCRRTILSSVLLRLDSDPRKYPKERVRADKVKDIRDHAGTAGEFGRPARSCPNASAKGTEKKEPQKRVKAKGKVREDSKVTATLVESLDARPVIVHIGKGKGKGP